MKQSTQTYITCPLCNAEYLPQEIFVSLIDNNANIEKTEDTHKIIQPEYSGQINETFTCDYCNTKFNVLAKLTFSSFIDDKFNFNELYSTKLNKSTILLKED